MFGSFFLAGFDCSAGYNVRGERIDHLAATQHERFLDEDYRRLVEVGIRGVRDGVCWPRVDRRGRYDFSSLKKMVLASRRAGIHLIYDLFHFGYPDDIEILGSVFCERFAEYCYAVARFLAVESDEPLTFTPVNEPSYFSWAAGQAGMFTPHLVDHGRELKLILARAALAGARALRHAVPQARIISVDPVCHVVAPAGRPELSSCAADFNENAVYESWDMQCGRKHPELGGTREELGIVGINYYWTNQWELGSPEVPLGDDDPRRLPLRSLVQNVWERYGGEILITETSHLEGRRGPWLHELAEEVRAILDGGIPLLGVCLYPVLGMPHWHHPDRWMRMGLWDLQAAGDGLLRVPYEPAITALRKARLIESPAALQRSPISFAPSSSSTSAQDRSVVKPRIEED